MIDKKRLLIFCDGDQALVEAFLAGFRKEVPDTIGAMRQSLAQQKWDDLANSAHKIKSHCAYLGLNDLEGISKKLEEACENSNVVAIGEHAEQLISGLGDVLRTL